MNYKYLRQGVFALSIILLCGAVFHSKGRENTFPAAEIPIENNFSPVIFDDDGAEFEIFELVNQERRRKRLGSLEWNEAAAKLARNYSKKMAREDFFAHYDADGKGIIDRARSARLKNWSKIGENLFFCQGIRDYSAIAVKGWMNSAGHRRNLLDREWTATGIGVAESRAGKIYVTQVFIK